MGYDIWKDKRDNSPKVDLRGVQGNFFSGLKNRAIGLSVGEGLEIIQSFNPLPLYEVMDQQTQTSAL
ncbi:MAG: DUF2249 domain-containing protein [Roseburia sp.]|nr:DUF2249 domain-containing protein [Roseburia sp.]